MPGFKEAPPFDTIIHQAGEQDTNTHHKPRHEKAPTLARRAKRLLAQTTLGATMTAGAFVGALHYDIHEGREAIANSHPSLEHVYDAATEEYNDAATVILPGLGTRSADYAAERLKAHTETGHVFALEYSNQDIDIDELTETVVRGLERQSVIDAEPIKYVNFDGYSMGGVVLLAVAANIHENYPEYTVTSVSLNSTPVGEGSLTQASSKSIEMLSSAIDFCNHVKICEGIEYSNVVHHVIEIASRHGDYYDSSTQSFSFGGFHKSVSLVNQKLAAEDAPSLVLALNQASALQGASSNLLRESQEQFHIEYGVEQSIQILSKASHGNPPVALFYTMAEDPANDPVVNVEASADALRAITERYDIGLNITPLAVGHVDLYQKSEQYDAYIERVVNPAIKAAIQREEAALSYAPRIVVPDNTSPLQGGLHSIIEP